MSEKRADLIEEADKLQSLGNYKKALALFEDAEQIDGGLKLAIDISSLLITQGCEGRASQNIERALELYRYKTEEKYLVDLAELVKAFASASVTLKSSEWAKVNTDLYDKYLKNRPREAYTKRWISLDGVSRNANSLMHIVGVVPSVPVLSQEMLRDLFEDFLAKESYYEALALAKSYASSSEDYELYQRLLNALEAIEPDKVPKVTLVNTLVNFADVLESRNEISRRDDLNDRAIELFQEIGHTHGHLLIEMRRCLEAKNSLSAATRMERLLDIKDKLEEFGDFGDSRQLIRSLFDLALQLEDAKVVETLEFLDRESMRLREISGSRLTWMFGQLQSFGRWKFLGANTGRMLSTLKAIYDSLVETDAPRIRNDAARLISEAYEKLGDNDAAKQWKIKIQDVAMYSQVEALFADPFIAELEVTTVAPDDVLEDEKVEKQLQQAIRQTSGQYPIAERWVMLLKLCQMSEMFLNQVKLRGIGRTRKLVSSCVETAELLLPRITKDKAITYTGNILQVKARMTQMESFFTGDPVGTINLDKLRESILAQRAVVDYFELHGPVTQRAMAQQSLAMSLGLLWTCEGEKPDSSLFHEAVGLYEAAGKTLQRWGTNAVFKGNARYHLKLWFKGHDAGIAMPVSQDPTIPTKTAQEKTLECIKVLEDLMTNERLDLSALGTEQAILSKQKLGSSEDAILLFETGLPVLAAMNHNDEGVWNTVQKSKARSVSDLLGLGIRIPQNLQHEIDKNPETRQMLENEQKLLHAMEISSGEDHFQIAKNLEVHRRAMRANGYLRQVLELREGAPVSLSKLKSLSSILSKSGTGRRILFVDWILFRKTYWLLLFDGEQVQVFNLKIADEPVAEWRKKYLYVPKPMNDDDLEPLQSLHHLIAPLVASSKENDLLVLCPTKSLHGVPLHAATIAEDSKISLIERNPVIYCPSLTVFEQCVSRANDTESNKDPKIQSILAVYESPNGYGWENQREEIYEMCYEIAEELRDAKIFTGSEVDKALFQSQCGASDIIHFFGHAANDANTQYIEICAARKTEPDVKLEPALKAQPLNLLAEDMSKAKIEEKPVSADSQPEIDQLTISDIFTTRITSSHFNLIACGSSSQIVKPGDEPWGIVTALLCAGATSVGGTLWPIQVSTGQEFMRKLFGPAQHSKTGNQGGFVDLAVELQETIKKMKKDADFREPYDWAGFVLNGSWFYC